MKRMITAACIASIALLLSGAVLAQTAPAPGTTAVGNAPTASLWSRLWSTPDQRGQTLLQQGDAAGAAQTFSDPQRKGHAALQAQDYTGAVKTLTGIDTAEAHYNRGNALAHTGDLQASINAYDAALKLNHQHTDARHNRDVVAAALKKQKDDKKDNDAQNKQENPEKKTSDGDKAGNQADRKPDGNEGKPDAKPGEGKDSKSSDKQGDKPGQTPPASPGEPTASAPQTGARSTPNAPAPKPKDEAAQALRDAQSALGKGANPPTVPQNGVSDPASGKLGAQGDAKQPMTEKQIAQEQWLRAIPDDPGGLLRRKFLIEHMLRQQGQKP